jgi:hypothetical protein
MLGCGGMAIFVFFAVMMDFSKVAIGKAQVKRQRDDVAFDLPLLFAAVNNYAMSHGGKLPPMDSPASFKKALFPALVTEEDTFIRHGDKVAYLPNPEISGKLLRTVKNPDKTVLLSEPVPGLSSNKPKDGPPPRMAIYLDSSVHNLETANAGGVTVQ